MRSGQPVVERHAGTQAVSIRSRVGSLCWTLAFIAASPALIAQEQTTPRAAPSADTTADTDSLTTVVVTGTSIQSVDSEAYRSAPVSVVTADAIQKSGAANLEGFFQTQPDFMLSGQSSYTNTGGQSGADGTTLGATTLNLRGLGPQYTLVLLNGRRFQAEDPANIDLIPVDAIERVEVLKSGASAVYGSDAVAGVVNIITKRNADGFNFDGYYGESGRFPRAGAPRPTI
jgi:iron complex outermembrane receptor protein